MSPATLFSDLMAGVTGEGRIGDGRRPHFQRWLVAWSLGGRPGTLSSSVHGARGLASCCCPLRDPRGTQGPQ